jgi:LPXTG-motif cell wall-anchored protein
MNSRVRALARLLLVVAFTTSSALAIGGPVAAAVIAKYQGGECPVERPRSTERLGAEIPGDEGAVVLKDGFAPITPVGMCVYPDAQLTWKGKSGSSGDIVVPVDSTVLPPLSNPLPDAMYFVLLGDAPSGQTRALTEVIDFGASASGGDSTATPTAIASSTDASLADSGASSIQLTFLLGVCLVAGGWWLVRRRRLSA